MFLVEVLMAIMVTAESLSKTLKLKEVSLAWDPMACQGQHMGPAWTHSLDPGCTGDGRWKHCPLALLSQG